MAALRRCWMDDDSEFHGEFFNFDPVWSFPKPIQKPHPPVLFGSSGGWDDPTTTMPYIDRYAALIPELSAQLLQRSGCSRLVGR